MSIVNLYSMSSIQKNADGIRRAGSGQDLPLAGQVSQGKIVPKPPRSGEPIRLVPRHIEKEKISPRLPLAGQASQGHDRDAEFPEAERPADEALVIPEAFSDAPSSRPWPARPWPDLALPGAKGSHPSHAPHAVRSPRRGSSQSWVRWGAGAGSVAIVIAFTLATTVFARLTVTVRPSVENAEIVRIGMVLDASAPRLALEQKIIPAEKLSFRRVAARNVSATGKARVEEGARGTILIYNAFNTSAQILVAGTRFATDTGAIYRIQKQVTVPAAKMEQGKLTPQAIEAEAVSDVKGEGANSAGPVTLKLPGFTGTPRYQGFYATAVQGFSGGFTGDSMVVTKEDVTKAQEQVTQAVFAELEAEMGHKTPAGLVVLKELRDVEIVKVDVPKAGSRANGTFVVSAEARGTALAFRESDVAALAASLALADRKDHVFIPDSARLSYAIKNVNFDKGKADVTVGGNLKIKAVIAEHELAGLIAGKKEGLATELFKERPELASFSFSFFPPWRSTTPGNPENITFRVENSQ